MIRVPQGVQKQASNAMWPPKAGLIQMVSVSPVASVMTLHASLTGFIHGEQEAAFAAGLFAVRRLVHGDHVPVAGIGLAGIELGQTVGDRALLKERIAEGDGSRLVGRRPGRTGQRPEVGEPGAVCHRGGAGEQDAARKREGRVDLQMSLGD